MFFFLGIHSILSFFFCDTWVGFWYFSSHFEHQFHSGFVFSTFLLMGSEGEGRSKKIVKDPGETGERTGKLYRVGTSSVSSFNSKVFCYVEPLLKLLELLV